MRISLRLRVLLLVFLVNALVFGAGGVYLFRLQLEAIQTQDDEFAADLVRTVQDAIRPDRLNVAHILRWPYWTDFEDAIFVDSSLREDAAGRIEVGGILLNPVGLGKRSFDFDRQQVLQAIRSAILNDAPVSGVQGGRVVPIADRSAEGAWGGVWFRNKLQVDRGALIRRLMTWFLLSTLLLTLGTFFALRRLVLDPLELLGDGARRVRAGEFSVRLQEPSRRDEMAGLVRSFNEMTSTVQVLTENMAEQVRAATAKARAAEAAAMIQRRLAAMGELAAGLAHEINNPLGGLQNALAVLRRGGLSEEKRGRYFDLLSEGLQRIAETVNRLRRFTPREAVHEVVDLVPVARDALELVRHRAERIGVELVFEVTPQGGPAEVFGARNEIGQALLNLLSNALDALEGGGSRDRHGPRIAIRIERTPEGVRLVVRDNGPGVEAHELPRVSDLFYTTKEVGKGTGLGLSLVHSTLSRHGGRVTIASEKGAYFEVELWFPRLRAEAGP